MVNCMRCGKETEGKAVFCPECLEEMERYPVKPGTPVHIPSQPNPEVRKTVKKKKELSIEEQLVHAQQAVKALFITSLCLLVALIVAVVLLLSSFANPTEQPEETNPPKTRNYTIVAPDED